MSKNKHTRTYKSFLNDLNSLHVSVGVGGERNLRQQVAKVRIGEDESIR
jgi:hypothetical protein